MSTPFYVHTATEIFKLDLWKEAPSYTRFIEPTVPGDPLDIPNNLSIIFTQELGFIIGSMTTTEIKDSTEIPSCFTADKDFSSGVITGLSRDPAVTSDRETLETFNENFPGNPKILVTKKFKQWLNSIAG